jgi:hypothetical protein
MSDVFISYKRERRAAAEHVAEILKRYGFDVWFDYALVKGRDFAQQIEQMIRSSNVLVVLWCKKSVGSRWVQEEVDLAQQLEILIPVKIEPCELPVGNRRIDCINLADWDGGPRSRELDNLILEIGKRLGRVPNPDFIALKEYDSTWRRFGAPPLSAFALDPETPDAEVSQGRETSRPASPSISADGGKNLSILRDIWMEVRTSENVDRLGRFLEQVRDTPFESAVEERIERLERARTTTGTADWLRHARPILEQVKELYARMGWRQNGPVPDPDVLEGGLRFLVSSLPPIPENSDVIHLAKVLQEYLNTKIHHGLPIPDDYTLTSVFPLPESYWGEPGQQVKACVRPGIHSSYYHREGFGSIREGLLVSPELVFVE